MNNPLLNKLAAKNCAVEEALNETYMGMEPFYVKMLNKLPANTALARMHAAFDANDINAFFEAAHELKGLYATLGLTPAYKQCFKIVEIVRPRQTFGNVAELLPELDQVNAELVGIITNG